MATKRASNSPITVFAFVGLLTTAGLMTAFFSGQFSPDDTLVVYCAHDSIFSGQILRRFEQETGITISERFDTEATKSLGLVNLLIREKDHPRCDVFWNNQVLGTMGLKEQGLLEPYKGPGYRRIDSRYKDPDGYWTGFAGRMRVYIVNTDQFSATPATIQQRMSGDLSRFAIAKPLYGTTLCHYSLLWELWGEEKTKAWHDDSQQRGRQVVAGNAMVKNLVASGACDLGWTDSDDFYIAKDEHKPVTMFPIRLEDGATICIANSVAIIRGTKKTEAARKLVDFLLSEKTELELAASKSRQIPLGTIDENELSEEVRELKQWAEESYDLTEILPSRQKCLLWLKQEFLQ